jgi:hypothetical protein
MYLPFINDFADIKLFCNKEFGDDVFNKEVVSNNVKIIVKVKYYLKIY